MVKLEFDTAWRIAILQKQVERMERQVDGADGKRREALLSLIAGAEAMLNKLGKRVLH